MSISETIRRALGFMSRRARLRWAALIPLALAGAAAEAAAAGGLFGLIRIVGDPARAAEIPVASTIVAWLPSQEPRTVILTFTVLLTAFTLAKNVLQVGQTYVHSRLVAEGVADLSERMFDAYLGVPYVWHLRRNSATLLRNVLTSSEIVYRTVMASAVALAFEIFVVCGIVSVLMLAAPVATLAITVPLAITSVVLVRLMRSTVGRWGERSHRLTGEIVASLQQTFGALKEVKVLQREAFFHDAFARRQRALVRVRHLQSTLSALPRVLVEALFVAGAFVLVAVILRREAGDPDILPLLGLYAYAGFRVIPSANRIMLYVNEIRGAAPHVRQLSEDVARIAPLLEAATVERHVDGRPFVDRVTVEDVSFTYEDTATPVLRGVDLTIRRGESIGIVGLTGSGKSTLVDLLIGILEPDAGRITIDGHELRTRRRAWQRVIGYVPQAIVLVDDTLRRNVALGMADDAIDEARLATASRIAQLDGVVAALPAGLDTVVGERGTRLSGGERQRVGIARALYHEPEVLVFDEATSALDNQTEAALMERIAEVARSRTLIVVAHRMSTVQGCDRLVFLRDGQVDDVGGYDELLARNASFRAIAMRVDDGT